MKKIKYLPFFLLLASCQSNPLYCETNPEWSLCNEENYTPRVKDALRDFKVMEHEKAFAIGGFGRIQYYAVFQGLKNVYEARRRALSFCQSALDRNNVIAKCHIIR